MNNGLSEVKEVKVSDLSRTALLFDAIPGDNPHGGQELIPSPERHILYLKEDGVDIYDMEKNGNKGKRYLKVNNFCFADGHVKPVTINEVPSLIWKPLKH
jgi:prepilin-type processing-associated H-X9-DG protein